MSGVPTSRLLEIGRGVVTLAQRLGAEEVSVSVSSGTSTELSRRDGRVEKAQESRSLAASVELMVDGRFSSHSTNDLRPEAFQPFLERAIAATRFLESDPDRALPPREQMGVADANLDLVDPEQAALGPDQRRAWVEEMEARTLAAAAKLPVRSATAYVWDGRSETAWVTSHGFEEESARTSFGHGATLSLEDQDGRLPEGWSMVGASHRADMPSVGWLAEDAAANAARRLGAKPITSGRYPMLLDRRAVGRVLGTLLSPLGGTSLYEGRSCMAGKRGQRVASSAFTLRDEPLIPRGSGSRRSDGDGIPAIARKIVEDGVLQMYFIDVYNSRRMAEAVTMGGPSNLVIAPGDASPVELIRALPQVIRVEGFLGGNSNAASGDFSFGVQGSLLEHGEVVASLAEMNVSGNIFDLMERYQTAANDPWIFSAWRCPTLLFDDVQFSGT